MCNTKCVLTTKDSQHFGVGGIDFSSNIVQGTWHWPTLLCYYTLCGKSLHSYYRQPRCRLCEVDLWWGLLYWVHFWRWELLPCNDRSLALRWASDRFWLDGRRLVIPVIITNKANTDTNDEQQGIGIIDEARIVWFTFPCIHYYSPQL